MLTLRADGPEAVAVVAAILSGDVDALRGIFRDNPALAGARIVDGRGVGRTLAHIVADWPGHFPHGAETVAVLAEAGADVDAGVENASGHAETPLHWAASSDDVEVLDALLDCGADIEAPGAIFTGGSPMSDAVVFGQWRAARRLAERGAATTIWQAAALGLLNRVQEYVSTGSLSARDLTNAFWNACRGGQQPVAEYLLEQGAEINWVGHDQKTPYDAAMEAGDESLIRWLRARGAKSGPELRQGA